MNGDPEETPNLEPEDNEGDNGVEGTPARPPTIFIASAVAGFLGVVAAGAASS